ncbi:MAG: DNA polymerase III subunit delta, partial [Oscillospiraceae bacterium]|nr:DNA polymerase III subunit delta [Oscillospiraceae bacterium]
LTEMIIRKAAKKGVVISPEDASYLCERVLGNMTLIVSETEKLMDYVGTGGVITREAIDKLVGKLLDTGVFELATAINAGEREKAFRILDDLFAERIEAVNILSAMTTAYLDFYRAKLGKTTGVLPAQISGQFGYKGREWVVKRAMNSVSRLRLGYLRETLFILSEADLEIKSSPVDTRTILDKTVTKLFVAGEKRYV